MFAGVFDPSLYLVILNAKELGWSPRPPNLDVTDAQEIISCLGKISNRVSRNGKFDYRFTASLHERKHFCDMHLSGILWERFLTWFHCASNIFPLINNFRGKNIRLPLYNIFGDLRSDIVLSNHEIDIISKTCNQIFSAKYSYIMDYIFEVSASLLQFGIFPKRYSVIDTEDQSNYGQNYYEKYFYEALSKFDGHFEIAFSFYNFCSWFCRSKDEIELVRKRFTNVHDIKKTLYNLLNRDGFYQQKLLEIENDNKYFDHHSKNSTPIQSSLVVDLPNILSRLISYRTDFFGHVDAVISILADISSFSKWIEEEAAAVPLLVDFRRELNSDDEITVNYEPSRWITPRTRFLYYNDNIGLRILTSFEVDMLTWIQHLCRFIVSPTMQVPFKSVFIDEEFLGFKFTDDRQSNTEHGEHKGSKKGLKWNLEVH